MPPNNKRKASLRGKSKLSTSTLLDNLPAKTRPKRTASVISLLTEAPIITFTENRPPSQPNSQMSVNGKGKGKEKDVIVENSGKAACDDQLWTDKYAPQTESELAIHTRKVDEVRQWLKEALHGGPNGTLKKYRKVLVLSGPAGTGKTATLKILAKELAFDIVEWQNALDDSFAGDGEDYAYESLAFKFQNFLTRASSCKILPILADHSFSTQPYTKQVILLEDLPNILHLDTAVAFHAALEDFVNSNDSEIPVVCIISDSGVRGEDPDGDMSTRYKGRRSQRDIDVRSLIPPSVFGSVYFREIRFNPIAPTIMTKALTVLVAKHFDGSDPSSFRRTTKSTGKPNKETIQLVVDSSNGDIRSAIMALQFITVVQLSKGSKGTPRAVLEAVSRREQSLVLFHLLGKILYNKRKGDPASNSSTIKAREKLEERDKHLHDQPSLPEHLLHQHRRSSRVDVNTLYADSPVDSSIFSLYIHQNYTQFCNDVDQCEAITEQMSWADSDFSEFNTSVHIPYPFYFVALNTLHYLPSPVPRLSQKVYKPAFFDMLRTKKEAEYAITDAEGWLNGAVARVNGGRRWSSREVVLELGPLLKAYETGNSERTLLPPLPRTHTKFSALSFVHPAKIQNSNVEQLNEDAHEPLEIPLSQDPRCNLVISSHLDSYEAQETLSSNSKWWLDMDDITEFCDI